MSDLAVEFAKKITKKSGARQNVKINKNVSVSCVEIDEKMGLKLGKEKGTYFTIEFPFDVIEQSLEKKTILIETTKAIKSVIKKCEITCLKSVLVVGLGNPNMIADCFGARTVDKILVTRHVTKSGHNLKNLCEVSSVATNVFGKTGLESFDIVNGIVKETKPDLVILIDTLVAGSVKKLCTNIQVANVGIVPGSGVDNARKELSRQSLGVPVITIGVPFVVYANSLCNEQAKKIFSKISDKKLSKELEFKDVSDLIVMPREIEQQIKFCSNVVGMAINQSLNPQISSEDIETFFV